MEDISKNSGKFIERANVIYANKYDYSKVEYKGCDTDVCIVCPEHGEFWQKPSNHLNGSECPICQKAKMRSNKLNVFLERAKMLYGDRYDYSQVDYVDSGTKVCIVCPEHGEFWVLPCKHLHGYGCPKCGLRLGVGDLSSKSSKLALKKQKFIDKANKVHNGKYDYSKVEYIDTHTKVCIVCPEHGEFWQIPNAHLCGCGCPACSNCKRPTTEEFIDKCKLVHGDRYDYSQVSYVRTHDKVRIICPEHGEFMQTPSSHLRGAGCPECGKVSRTGRPYYNNGKFIEKARKVHGERYDYSKVEYVDTNTPVCIICPEHGEFWQKPSNHLNGSGCYKCYLDGLRLNREKKREQKRAWFIDSAKLVHGDRYDYSEVDYKNSSTLVNIMCVEHGLFSITPKSHLGGVGCPECKRLSDAGDFIRCAKEVHGGKYDYSKVEYNGRNVEVCIICPEHGEFWQKPSNHLNGSGCPECAKVKVKTWAGDDSSSVGVCDIDGGKALYPIAWRKWRSMIRRCYNKRTQEDSPSYVGCSVHDDWLLFSNFKKWFDENWCARYNSSYHLDKDILVKGNRVYGPDTCCFVPKVLNLMVNDGGKKKNGLPLGVCMGRKDSKDYKKNPLKYYVSDGKYGVRCAFDTPEEAFLAYKESRELVIREAAKKFYDNGEISEKVYDALMGFEIEM